MNRDDEPTLLQTEAAIWDAVDAGWVEFVKFNPDGEPVFRVTEAGKARVEQMIREAKGEHT